MKLLWIINVFLRFDFSEHGSRMISGVTLEQFGGQTHHSSPPTSSAGSQVRSDFRSLADGVRDTPFSVSAGVTFLVALLAAINEL